MAPAGVSEVHVLAIGGGGGGSFPTGSAGSGYLNSATLRVTPGQQYSAVVGVGGKCGYYEFKATTGASSSFDSDTLVAKGGAPGLENDGSGPGGSGGGAGNGGAHCPGEGNGGMNGNKGDNCGTVQGAAGQGETAWNGHLANFKFNTLTAGSGGTPGSGTFNGYPKVAGGGGGGVLVNGSGPRAGRTCYGLTGGVGYGAGGGAGGYSQTNACGGSSGMNGLVYIEWNPPA